MPFPSPLQNTLNASSLLIPIHPPYSSNPKCSHTSLYPCPYPHPSLHDLMPLLLPLLSRRNLTQSFTQTPKPIERTHYCGIRSKSSFAILVKPTLANPLTETKMLSFFLTEQSDLYKTLRNSLRPVLTSSELDRAKHNTTTQNPMLSSA
jgi:hypothetical protein